LPDFEKENRGLVALVSALADSPRTILQTLAETILDITQCDSAGLSLLTRDGKTPDVSGKRFYWPAIAGRWSPHVGGGTPRNFGPCGDVLDQNRTLLFKHFERRYPYLLPVVPTAEECLLVPFYVRGNAVGTIWAITHDDRHKFDSEDHRVMESLGKFASSAYQALVSIDDLKFQVAEREKAEAELRGLTNSLEGQVRARTEALVDMTRKLIKAQEQERARIARDLHDDVNQRLALLTIDLEQLRENPYRVRSRLQELKEQITNISKDLHAVAHDLHSSKLEYLGAAAGMKSWCREFAEREKIEIDCRFDMRSTLSTEIGLCLFRVLQQALNNAAKHSGVKHIEVQLREESGEIDLIVRDSGKGFDVEAVKQGKGLGLASMRERVRLVNGTISIESKPMSGTCVHVHVPLDSVHGSERLAV